MQVISIFERLFFIEVILILIKTNQKIYFLNSNITSKILCFLKIKRIRKIDWDLIKLEVNNYKIITKIKENQEVSNFVYSFLDETKKNSKIENNFFHYLVKYTSNQKIIGKLSLENLLVFLEAFEILLINSKKQYYFESSILDNFILKKYSSDSRSFFFKKMKFKNSFFIFFFLIKKIRYLFIFETLKFQNKSIVVMDSPEMNNPEIFFKENNFYNKIIFLTNQKKNIHKMYYNYYKFIDLKIILTTLKLHILKKFAKNSQMNSLFLKYYFEKLIFKKIFTKYNIKKFVTAYLPQPFSSSAVAAIHELNGKTCGFTMSFCEKYSSNLNIDAYDYFISINNDKYKKLKISNLKSICNLGYIGDYKFKKNKQDSKILRQEILNNGAKYVVGFYDQGHHKDKMFEIGYHVARQGYEFLLNKIIQNQNIGLIIKPKKPKFLKEKLGSSYNLLLKAKDTGRLIVLDDYPIHHVKNFEDNPAKVGFASDLTIHDTLLAGTAGLESALTGCKSVYFDYYNSKQNQFLDIDLKIVFNDWNVLWDHIENDMKNENTTLGDWDKIINNFDKYRDGKSNQRIINFINDF